MKNLYPTYRGKSDSGEIIIDMVDRYGRVWGTGVGADRVQAMYAARHAMPPKGIIKKVLRIATSNPVKAAVLTGVATATYALRRMSDDYDPKGKLLLAGVIALGAGALAWLGIKLLTVFVGRDPH